MKDNNLAVIEKKVKSSFKKKFRVTLALVVSLMISGVALAVEQISPIEEGSSLIWTWTSSEDRTHDTEYGVEVVEPEGGYPSADELLTSKVEVDLINLHVLEVSNTTGENSSGIYIPGTDKLFEFYLDEETFPYGNSYFKVDNQGRLDVEGRSAYGIHVEYRDEPSEEQLQVLAEDVTEDEEDPVYAYPDIEISNSETGEVAVSGEVNAEGIKIDTPFTKVDIGNEGSIIAQVGVEDTAEIQREDFGGATGINVLLPAEEKEATNPTPEWIESGIVYSSEEGEISSLPMDIDIENKGVIEAGVENRDVARIMGIHVGEYDDHTLTDSTEIVITEEEEALSLAALAENEPVIAPLASDHSSGGSHSHGESGGCGTKPLDAMVFTDITNEGEINIRGNNLSAVQAVGINSRMPEGTQTTIKNGENGSIHVDVTLTDARQTKIEEDPTSGNLYGINVFNSGRPSRVESVNAGEITVEGEITKSSTEDATDPVGIQAFGIKNKARGRDSVADINNNGSISVTSIERQNTADMDYTYYNDTEGKEIFGARAIGINATSAGRGAYTEVTNGDYDLTVDTEAMDRIYAGEDVVIYDEIVAQIQKEYEDRLGEFYTNSYSGDEGVHVSAKATSEYGYAEAKGIWATAEAIENSQFVYNSEDSKISAEANALHRGAEALGIESVSYQNTVINQGDIEVASYGKTATGIGILAEVSEIEEEEMNEHARKPEFLGPEIGMPPDLPGNRDDHQGGENSGGGEETVALALEESATYEALPVLTDEEGGTPNGEVSQGDVGSGEGGVTDTKQPEIGKRNKYVLNTGDIEVRVNQPPEDDLENETDTPENETIFALGAGISVSRVVLETVSGDRVGDFEEKEPAVFALASVESGDDLDGTAGATTASPDESLTQEVTNNGNIDVDVKGKTALASGINSLTKVEVRFDTDGDGVSDGADIAPTNPKLSKDLDGDGIDNSIDPDADGDGFYNEKYISSLSPEEAEGLLVDYFDHDSDNDGINNRKDNDDDGDGILDIYDESLDQGYGYDPITPEEYEEFMNTPGGMPENLIETSGILEPEEAEINTKITNNGLIDVEAVSEGEEGIAIANGIATDVVWEGLQKPVYEPYLMPAPMHSEVEGAEITIIEKNYENFKNGEEAQIIVRAESEGGTAAAFGMRIGNYYAIDDAAEERTPVTKHYAGDYEETEDGKMITEYGLENAGNITVTAEGRDAKAFGMMSGYYKESGKAGEEFVVSTVKNTGDIIINHSGSESSEGAGIVAFADQQIEYLPVVMEGGVLLPAAEEEGGAVTADTEVILEDYVIKDPEEAVVRVENSGDIRVADSGRSYGIYAGINPVEDIEGNDSINDPIKVREIDLTDEDRYEISGEAIIAETHSGNDQEPMDKQIGTLYTVKDTTTEEEYQFVMHAPEDSGEEMPEKIYVVDEGGDMTAYADETYKLGKTHLEVNNSGIVNAGGGIGIYLASEGTVKNSGTINASQAIVGSEGDDLIELLGGSVIDGNIETRGGDDRLSLDSGSFMNGNIDTGIGNDRVEISQGASLNGDIRLGAGNDRLSLGKNSFMKGNIDTGMGNDRVEISQGASLKGNIDLGPGNDTLTMEGGGFAENADETTMYTVDGGEGYDRIDLIGSEENSELNVLDRKMQNFEMAKITGNWKLKHEDGLNITEGGRIINKAKIEFDGK